MYEEKQKRTKEIKAGEYGRIGQKRTKDIKELFKEMAGTVLEKGLEWELDEEIGYRKVAASPGRRVTKETDTAKRR
jgi:carbamate kinase